MRIYRLKSLSPDDRIWGPLLDRIDIHIEVPAVEYKELSSQNPGTSSQSMRQQVEHAQRVQSKRFAQSRIRNNAQMSSRQIRDSCPLDRACRKLLRESINELGLSARAHDKIIRLARTIADLEDSDDIQTAHVNEAINYRMLDRKFADVTPRHQATKENNSAIS